METKTNLSVPTWDEIEQNRMKREDEGVTRRLTAWKNSRRDRFMADEIEFDEEIA